MWWVVGGGWWMVGGVWWGVGGGTSHYKEDWYVGLCRTVVEIHTETRW